MKTNFPRVALLAAALSGGLIAAAGADVIAVDPAIPPYKSTSGVSGSISSIGSDTLNNLMTLWAEGFKKLYPSVNIGIEGKGSSTAPPALISGTAQLGPMSRTMKDAEIDEFERKFGYKPTAVRTAVDALALFVNKDNPLECVSLVEADAAFSKSRRRGHPQNVTKWGQLGLTSDWADRPISLYGRNSASGTYGFFKEHALQNGDYKDGVKEQPGSASVVQGVTVDRDAMGYSGIGYVTPGVKALALSAKKGDACVEGTPENSYNGKYPLARFLYVYVNKAPGKPLEPLTREYLKMVLSKEGQEVVIQDGYFPLPAKVTEEDLKKLD